jgi:hypothetical protein
MSQGPGFGILPPPGISAVETGAAGIVTSVISETGSLAAQAQSTALAAISALGSFAADIPQVVVPDIPVQQITPQPLGTAPTEPDFAASYPTAPSEPSIGGTVSVEMPSEPEFNVAEPLLLDIALPDPLSAVLPTAPETATIAPPTPFSEPIPTAPDLTNVTAPSDFTGTVPTAPSLSTLTAPAAFSQDVPSTPTINEPDRPGALSATLPAAPTITSTPRPARSPRRCPPRRRWTTSRPRRN